MSYGAWYNENDKFAAQWLRNLISEGHIAPGEVDERDIRDVRPDELAGFAQHHFFAGIGGWSLALRLAGWPDDRPVWTGSCPCQRFSGAARGRNVADDLWLEWYALISSVEPRELFGEQVPHARDWFDRVCDEMGALGYEVGAAILPAAVVGKDHARPRIFFACHADRDGKPRLQVDAEMDRLPRRRGYTAGLARANGLPRFVGSKRAQLTAYGNAIVPQVAAEFIGAYLDIEAAQLSEAA